MTKNNCQSLNSCGCGAGREAETPLPLANRPGLDQLAYRVGTQAAFLATMKARLSSSALPALAGLTSHETADPAIAWLDAWAAVADVLSLYQERLANEGYLRTATERRSLVELARLVGYKLRPGVAASVYLAFSLEKGYQVEIPKGNGVQSVPNPGEQAQPFETAEPLPARAEWNELKPRLTQPQYLTAAILERDPTIYLEGIRTNLNPNDPLLFTFWDNTRALYRVLTVAADPPAGHTRITVQPWAESGISAPSSVTLENFANRYLVTTGTTEVENEVQQFGIPKNNTVVHTEVIRIIRKYLTGYQDLSGSQLLQNLDQTIDDLTELFEQRDLRRYRCLRDWVLALLAELKEIRGNLAQLLEGLKCLVQDYLNDKRLADSYLPRTKSQLQTLLQGFQQSTDRPLLVDLKNVITILTSTSVTIQANINWVRELLAVQEKLNQLLSGLPGSDLQSPPWNKVPEFIQNNPDLETWMGSLLEGLRQVQEELSQLLSGLPNADLQGQLQKRLEDITISLGKAPESIQKDPDLKAWVDKVLEGLRQVNEELSQLQSGLTNEDLQGYPQESRFTASELIQNNTDLKAWVDNLREDLRQVQEELNQLLGVPQTATMSMAMLGDSLPETQILTAPADTGRVSVIEARSLEIASVRSLSALALKPGLIYTRRADVPYQLGMVMFPQLATMRAYTAPTRATPSVQSPPAGVQLVRSLEALRVKAGLFGHNAVLYNAIDKTYSAPTLDNAWNGLIPSPSGANSVVFQQVALDRVYDEIKQGSYVVIEHPQITNTTQPFDIKICQVDKVQTVSMWVENSSNATRVTLLTFKEPWLEQGEHGDQTKLDDWAGTSASNNLLRQTSVYAGADLLTLADKPLTDDIQGHMIELAELYRGLEPGRQLIVTGERTDLAGVTGLMDSELVRLDTTIQDVQKIADDSADLPGDSPHTFLRLAEPGLAYSYKPGTVTIYGNVVKATHGQTRREPLGSGNGTQAWQAFTLAQAPLTYLAAPTPVGAESSLEVRVNEVLWHEAEHLFERQPTDRVYLAQADDKDRVTVSFGDGQHGARLPTGVENVRAVYRTGLGQAGNVKAGQIRLLTSKPLGVKSVTNPQDASGGADAESLAQARRNIPLRIMALDRLVSVQDYADFARAYAGIGKTSATRLPAGRHSLLHLTIAGAGDIPIDRTGDLYLNLVQALRQNGDPYLPIQVDLRELKLLIIQARVQLWPDYLWSSVEPRIRAAMETAFSFENRELGQHVGQAEVVSTIQAVPGVAYVDLEILDAMDENRLKVFLQTGRDPGSEQATTSGQTGTAPGSEAETTEAIKQLNLGLNPCITAELARLDQDHNIRPAQIVFLTPTVKSTLILEEIKA